jgi:hypothetical protein
MSEEQLAAAYKPLELRELCRQLEVPTAGNREVLAQRVAQTYRLTAAVAAGMADPASMTKEQLIMAYSAPQLRELCYQLQIWVGGYKGEMAGRIAQAFSQGATRHLSTRDPVSMSEEQLAEAYTHAELQKLCRQLGVFTSGTKPALAQRIAQADRAQVAAAAAAAAAPAAAVAEKNPASMSEEELVAAYTATELRELTEQLGFTPSGQSKTALAQRLARAYRVQPAAVAAARKILASVTDQKLSVEQEERAARALHVSRDLGALWHSCGRGCISSTCLPGTLGCCAEGTGACSSWL